jgi:hypothetical protein
MYSWGTDTTGWNNPGKYRYDSARAPYLDKLGDASAKAGPRGYTRPRSPNSTLVDPRGKEISSDSQNPIIVGVDVTGSMSAWPGEIFDRLPLFYQTLSQYRPDTEMAFAAIGDANCDSYPLQVNSFEKGLKLEDAIKALYPEGGGGGQVSESYELFGYFMQEHCKTPNATSPFLFIFGDEKFYNTVRPDQIRHYIGDTVQDPVDSLGVWKSLTQRFNLYLLHKPYGHGGEGSVDKEVVKHWEAAIGKQRIVEVPSAERAVDIAMGIVAKHWGQYDDFGVNLSARQPDSVAKTVHYTLRHIPDAGTPMTASHLLMPGTGIPTTHVSNLLGD